MSTTKSGKSVAKKMMGYIRTQERREKKIRQLKLIIFILGFAGIFAWFFHLLQIYWAITKGGEYGITPIAYNLYGEMYYEFIGFILVFLFLIILTIYTLKKRWK